MRTNRLALAALVAGGAMLAATSASATLLSVNDAFTLFNHADGTQFTSPVTSSGSAGYGLRHDGTGHLFSFQLCTGSATGGSCGGLSTVGMLVTGADTVIISGTVYRSDRNSAGLFADPWTLLYTMTVLSDPGAGTGFLSATGAGTVVRDSNVAEFITLTGEADGGGIVMRFINDSHRLSLLGGGGTESYATQDGEFGTDTATSAGATNVGRGWVLPTGSTDDFLFVAQPGSPDDQFEVPIPAAAWLLGSAIAGLGVAYSRRRRASEA